MEREIEQIIYINKKKYLKLVIANIIFYILIFFISNINKDLIVIKNFYFLITSIIVSFLTMSIWNISKSNFYNYNLLLYCLSIIFNLLILSNINKKYLNGEVMKPQNHNVYLYIFLMIIAILMLLYREALKRKNTLHTYGILIFFSGIAFLYSINIENFKKDILQIKILYLIVGLYYILNAYKNVKKFEKIDYLFVGTVLTVIAISLSIISKNNIFIEFANFMNFSIMTFISIENMINIPYEKLIEKIKKESEEMDSLNQEVNKKNLELQLTHDITEKKELMFKEFLRNMPIAIAIISISKQRVIYANRNFIELMEANKFRDIFNRKINKLIELENISPKDIEKGQVYRGYINGKTDKKIINLEIIDKNIDGGEIIISVKDITSKINTEIMQSNMEERNLQEKMKRDFLSNISHDLKTPINVIYSAVQLQKIFLKNGDREGLNKYNSISKHNCLTLVRLTNNLIDTSKINTGHIRPNLKNINIIEFLEDIVQGIVFYAKQKNITLIFDPFEEEVFIDFDQEFMERVMLNLISNAIKYTESGGEIEVKVYENLDNLCISVKDNGLGISEKFLEKIYDKYEKGEDEGGEILKNTGIGMFVVKKLVELQNGRVEIDSEINKGTNVVIYLEKGVD